jgi:branched-chain amino acid transport system ATP-binding protein
MSRDQPRSRHRGPHRGAHTGISKSGVDILLVEQKAEIALSIADRDCILEERKVAANDDAKILAKSEKVQKAYLGI